jgi:nucleoside diphosphate kinase
MVKKLAGNVISELYSTGLKIVGLKLVMLTENLLKNIMKNIKINLSLINLSSI